MLCAIWYHLCNLQNERNTHGGVFLLEPAALLKMTLLCGCFSRFLNCTNDTKSCPASHMLVLTSSWLHLRSSVNSVELSAFMQMHCSSKATYNFVSLMIETKFVLCHCKYQVIGIILKTFQPCHFQNLEDQIKIPLKNLEIWLKTWWLVQTVNYDD